MYNRKILGLSVFLNGVIMAKNKRTKKQDEKRPALFLNLPINDSSEDAIGLASYADSISDAIDNGAQTIAITSSFGMGKTSVIELLRKRRPLNENHEEIIKVPMWTQLSKCSGNDNSIELHRNFVYQIARQINPRRGSYVIRRLSPNYRLLKIHTNRIRNWFLLIAALTCFAVSFVFNTENSLLMKFIPQLGEKGTTFSSWAVIIGLVFGAIAVTRSEIVFSNGKEESRRIESDEIIDLYYNEILQYRSSVFAWFKRHIKSKKTFKKHYLVVVEDLDRSNESEALRAFLMEIRKYYVPSFNDNQSRYRLKNKVTIIVNIKPESDLYDGKRADTTEQGHYCLYDKIFDYVVNIPTININDYETILESLLQRYKTDLAFLGSSTKNTLSDYPGMQWIIREPKVGMREIKDRLNRAILLFRSLKERFPSGNVAFERCAVVAFLTTAYEKDFIITKDDAFQELVNWGLKNDFKFNSAELQCKSYLKGCSDQYCKEVFNLVEAGLIDGDYRMYFYNYPKRSRINTIEENNIQNILLYNKEIDNLEEIVQIVEESGSKIIDYSLSRLRQLGLFLPEVVFQSENLYKAVIKRSFDWAIEWMNRVDTSPVSTEKTIAQIIQVLHYDPNRTVFNPMQAQEFVKIWEKRFSESQLMNLRLQLCKGFEREIIWYKQLFYGHHKIITQEEFDALSLSTEIELININNPEYSVNILNRVVEKYSNTEEHERIKDKIIALLVSSISILDQGVLAPLFLQYMLIDGIIVGALESFVIATIQKADESKTDNTELIELYNKLISISVKNKLSEQSLRMICYLETFDSYNLAVSEELERNGYYFESAMIKLSIGADINLASAEICNVLLSKKRWLLAHKSFLNTLRKTIAKKSKEIIIQYAFLFDDDCPIVSEEEFKSIIANSTFDLTYIKRIIPANIITESVGLMLAAYFSCEYRKNGIAFDILMYVSSFNSAIARTCFEALDFNRLKYNSFSSERRRTIKNAFASILDLDEPMNKILFMKKTKWLDSDYEKEIKEEIINNEELKDEYIKAIWVSSDRSVSSTTLDLLRAIKPIRALPTSVNDLLFKNKEYSLYIISKSLDRNEFIIETGDRGQILWPEYIKMFKENSVLQITELMGKNKEFLCKLMAEGDFSEMDRHSRMKLAAVYQTSDSLNDIVNNYDEAFALEYLTQIAGFEDEKAAIDYLLIINKSQRLSRSEKLYSHTYDMLISPSLKSKYTRIHKKNYE